MDTSQIMAELEKLKAENERLKRGRGLSFKVSEKGAVSVYGLRKFPVTLYSDEWNRILAQADNIHSFIQDNSAALSTKPVKEAA